MNAVKGIYHNGMVELIDKPGIKGTAEVLVIFPEKKKKISKIGGLFKGHEIDYAVIEKELKKLSKETGGGAWLCLFAFAGPCLSQYEKKYIKVDFMRCFLQTIGITGAIMLERESC